jgi:K+-transporting ATPase ATPase A chain
MTSHELAQIIVYFGALIIDVPLLGGYMAKVFGGERTLLSPVLLPVERAVYRLAGVDAESEQDWRAYALTLIMFNLLGFGLLFILQLLQGILPLNPARLDGVEPLLAFNTATSFMTNTNWQAYGGETTMSYLTQMLSLPMVI